LRKPVHRILAAPDELGMMAELGQDRVEHDAAEWIVFDAEHAQRRQRIRRVAIGLARLRRPRRIERHRQREGGTATAPRRDRDVATHRARQLLHRGQAEPGTAEARGDGDIGLGERTEQPLDLGHGQADAAVGDREGDTHPALVLLFALAACPAPGGTPRRGRECDSAPFGELDRIVDQVLERGTETDGIANHEARKLVGDLDFGLETFGGSAAGERIPDTAGERPQIEQILPQRAAAGALAGLGSVDEQRGQVRQMLGTGLDGVGPAPFALAEIGGRKQVADRQNTGQRCAHLVGKRRKRRLDHIRRGSLGAALAQPPGRPGPLPRRLPGLSRGAHCARFRRHKSLSKYPLRTPDRLASMARRNPGSHGGVLLTPRET